VVPATRPVIDREKGRSARPEPSAVPPVVGARVPKVSLQVPGLVALYRNQPVVAAPLGLPDAFSVAPAPEMALAASVVTDGAEVTKDSTAPNDVPIEFCAMAQ
jgi:hypothetical protein